MSDQEEFDNETDAEQDIILTAEDLRQLSPLDWARYGTNRIAYMRPVMVNNHSAIALPAAAGPTIGAEPAHDLGAEAMLQTRPGGGAGG